jgi:hypothetical protein
MDDLKIFQGIIVDSEAFKDNPKVLRQTLKNAIYLIERLLNAKPNSHKPRFKVGDLIKVRKNIDKVKFKSCRVVRLIQTVDRRWGVVTDQGDLVYPARWFKLVPEYKMEKELYEKGVPIREIARSLNCSREAVYQRLHKLGLR